MEDAVESAHPPEEPPEPESALPEEGRVIKRLEFPELPLPVIIAPAVVQETVAEEEGETPVRDTGGSQGSTLDP